MIFATISGIVKQEIRRCTREIARDMVALAVAGFMIAVAALMAVIAAFTALLEIWEPYWAAAAIGGAALLVALVVLLARKSARRSDKSAGGRVSAAADPPATGDAEAVLAALAGDTADLARRALDEAEYRYRRDPAGILVAAAAAGAIVGLLKAKK